MKPIRQLALAILAVAFSMGLAAKAAPAGADLPRVTFAEYPTFFTAGKPSFIYFCQADKSLCDKQSAEIARLSSQYPAMNFYRCDDAGEKAFAMLVIPSKMVVVWHDEPGEADIARIVKQAQDELH